MSVLFNGVVNAEIQKDAAGFIKNSDKAYRSQIKRAVRRIASDADKRPVVLLSGPSGSGKTTTAQIIEQALRESGHPAHMISMDNYYVRYPDMVLPTDDAGSIDYESPFLLDVGLFQQQLRQMLRGEPVEVPTYDFGRQWRAEETIPLYRKPGEIIIIEGIHALTPAVIGTELSNVQTLYISPRSKIGFDYHSHRYDNRLMDPSYVRLMRRMLRDTRTRDGSIESVTRKFASVTRGEKLYILPNKGNAQITINTSIPYEIPLYKTLLLPLLEDMDSVPGTDVDFDMLRAVLRDSVELSPELVAEDALVREFIGA